jgi:hypothetical protein
MKVSLCQNFLVARPSQAIAPCYCAIAIRESGKSGVKYSQAFYQKYHLFRMDKLLNSFSRRRPCKSKQSIYGRKDRKIAEHFLYL